MSNKLYVGGLSWDTNSSGLQAAFESYGEIEEATVVTDRDSGRSRGFGFVTFANSSHAQEAIALDGTQLDGREIKVSMAKAKKASW
ncbi:MAG: RNA-binding protein [Myxococcales bacterium]|nr:RNA-binding protein [Myxococcales bacterium]